MSNVLVYSGPGVAPSALNHTLRTLRALLPSYDVQAVDAKSIALDPWQGTASLFVLPGGRDLPYVEELSKVRIREDQTGNGASSAQPVGERADGKIKAYVQGGGSFLGICAGAYYASSACDFQRGTPLQVIGERPALRFFPGTCEGTVYPGFVYDSDEGARLIQLDVAQEKWPSSARADAAWTCHYNGGGAFVDADSLEAQGVEVLARYADVDAESETGPIESRRIKPELAGQAAIVRCSIGKGRAVLYGTHPEFPIRRAQQDAEGTATAKQGILDRWSADGSGRTDEELAQLEAQRLRLFGATLQDLGLEVKIPDVGEVQEAAQPADGVAMRLSALYLATREAQDAGRLLSQLAEAGAKSSKTAPPNLFDHETLGAGAEVGKLSDQNDTFVLVVGSTERRKALARGLLAADYGTFRSAPSSGSEPTSRDDAEPEVDLNKVPKYIVTLSAEEGHDASLTPHFDVGAYFRHLAESRQRLSSGDSRDALANLRLDERSRRFQIGNTLLYGQVVTSTQTMLDKNYKLLTQLPNGFTALATHQMSGRGRGKNAWISPLGCLQFSSLVELPARCGSGIVFLQYLAGLAIVQGVRKALGPEYGEVGDKIRIKWPNDVYAEVGEATEGEGERKGTFVHQGKRYAKMAGVLVNSQFVGGSFKLIVGCGINCLNSRPTTSLSDLIAMHNASLPANAKPLDVVSQERLAGAILSCLERAVDTFVSAGASFAPFVEEYSKIWLHSDQLTTLTTVSPPQRVRIVGVTSDFGMLRTVPESSNVRSSSPSSWAASSTGVRTSGGGAGMGIGANQHQGGEFIDLQPDGNSFDMLQNLLKRKE